jgi:type I restriction enzyme S subunit
VTWSGGEGALNQHLFKVTPAGYPKWFVYRWLHQHLDAFRQIAADKATTMGHIKRGHLSAALTVIPTDRVLAAADAVLSPIQDRRLASDIESRHLAETRDALLPRLVGGWELTQNG